MPAGQWGGVQLVAEGLARGFAELDGEDEYLFLGYEDSAKWLDPHLGANSRRVEVPVGHGRSAGRRLYDAIAARSPQAGRLIGTAGGSMGRTARLPKSDGLAESLGLDVIHFVTPQAYLTKLPSIYQPQDLLHLHVPAQFSRLHRTYRDRAYRAFCHQAAIVAVMTAWGRDDLVKHFGLRPQRVAVVPWPPVVETSPASALPHLAGLPNRFLLYPAQTWPHKNHLGLVDALAILRNPDIHVVCTGRLTDHHRAVERASKSKNVRNRLTFTGYIDEAMLGALYGRALGLVFPSQFEGWGLPIVEAFAAGVPVACSDIPMLDEAAGEAALRFDPADAEGMARAMERIWTDVALRDELRARGLERVRGLTWDRTSGTFRALYRSIAGIALADQDLELLRPPTLPS
jgi:glycosyltransferase involved in cell wall biosynthesis